jgi:predicted nucleotidyltransferase
MTLSGVYRRIMDAEPIPASARKLLITCSNWLHQGFTYMNWFERALKIALEAVFFLAFLATYGYISTRGLALGVAPLLAAFMVAHTLNWLLNGHFFTLLKLLELQETPLHRFSAYVDSLKERARNNPSISWVACYGSLSRGELNEMSDLDVRVVQKPGLWNGLRVAGFVLGERTRAFFRRFPLDIYAVSKQGQLRRLREDEAPVVIYRSEQQNVQG